MRVDRKPRLHLIKDRTKLDTHPLHAFFLCLADAVGIFRGMRDISNANCKGCLVTVGKNKKKGHILFQFFAKKGRLVSVDIDMRELAKDPEDYIDSMLESINTTLNSVDTAQRILIPVAKPGIVQCP